jgi:hypothetical protein
VLAAGVLLLSDEPISALRGRYSDEIGFVMNLLMDCRKESPEATSLQEMRGCFSCGGAEPLWYVIIVWLEYSC